MPTRVGTILRSRGYEDDQWSELEVIDIVQHQIYTMHLLNSTYQVTYTFIAKGDATELEYYEWVTEGELDNPTSIQQLELLKKALEETVNLK